jgi:transposase
VGVEARLETELTTANHCKTRSQHGIAATIPTRRNQRKHARFDRTLYRERNQVERLFNRFKQFRRVAMRYEKRGVNYLAMVTLAAVTGMLWSVAAPCRPG